jgi:amphiphysin
MQRVQRKFGTFLPRTANESQVGSLLKDMEDAEGMLAEV